MASKVQGAKNRRVAAIQQTEVVNAVKGLSIDSVSRSITETQVEVQRVLADLSGRVMERLQELENLEETIRVRTDDLKKLHAIEVQATTLDELEEQIKEQRRMWDEEQLLKKREFAEQQSERNKSWKREQEEYQYKQTMENRKVEDAFKASMDLLTKQNKDKQELLEKQWNEREVELKKRETELAELKAFKEAAPEMIRKAANEATAIATNSVKREYEQKGQLAAKDAEMEKRLAEQAVASLQKTITELQAQIVTLKAGLEQAQRDVKEISAKALESASGRATTDALQRIMEKEQGGAKVGK
jgi:colicin import membrane protein